jgi:hypothetical protein
VRTPPRARTAAAIRCASGRGRTCRGLSPGVAASGRDPSGSRWRPLRAPSMLPAHPPAPHRCPPLRCAPHRASGTPPPQPRRRSGMRDAPRPARRTRGRCGTRPPRFALPAPSGGPRGRSRSAASARRNRGRRRARRARLRVRGGGCAVGRDGPHGQQQREQGGGHGAISGLTLGPVRARPGPSRRRAPRDDLSGRKRRSAPRAAPRSSAEDSRMHIDRSDGRWRRAHRARGEAARARRRAYAASLTSRRGTQTAPAGDGARKGSHRGGWAPFLPGSATAACAKPSPAPPRQLVPRHVKSAPAGIRRGPRPPRRHAGACPRLHAFRGDGTAAGAPSIPRCSSSPEREFAPPCSPPLTGTRRRA